MSDRTKADGGLGATSRAGANGQPPEEESDEEPRFFQDPKRLAFTGGAVIVLIAAIYVLFPAIVGITLVVSMTFLLVNLLVDLSYAVLDPRVRR